MKLNKKQIIVMWIGLSLLLPVFAYFYLLKNDYRANEWYIEQSHQQLNEMNTSYDESKEQVLQMGWGIESVLELAKGQEKIVSDIYNRIEKTRKKNEKISYKLKIIPFGIIAYISILFAIVIAFNKPLHSKRGV